MGPQGHTLIDALVSNGALLVCTAMAIVAIMVAEYWMSPGRRQRTGFGLRPLADLIKLAGKRSSQASNGGMGGWAPTLLLAISFTALAVIPFCLVSPNQGHAWTALAAWGGSASQGVIYVVALGFVALQVGLFAGERASAGGDQDFGGLRLVARQLSCYLALGLALLGVVLVSGASRFNQVLEFQASTLGYLIPSWNLFVQPLGFAVCIVALVQVMPWRPITQSDPSRGGRLNSLYAGPQLALIMVAERVHLIAASALVVTLYLGGGHLPGIDSGSGIPAHVQVTFTAIKTAIVVLGFLWVRSSLPSLALERAASFGWKFLLPVAFANLLLVALGSAFLTTPSGSP